MGKLNKNFLKSCTLGVLTFLTFNVSSQPVKAPEPVVVDKNTVIDTESGFIPIQKIDEKKLPSLLTPWVDWVKLKNPQTSCPQNNENEKTCVFTSLLKISDNKESYGFEIQGMSFLPEFWLKLPSGAWPQNTKINGQNAQVLDKDGVPLVKVSPGNFVIDFDFNKEKVLKGSVITLNEQIPVVLNMTKEGWSVDGKELTLHAQEETSSSQDGQEEIKVYRRLDDGIPLQLITHIDITYSGKEKDLFLGKILPENFKLTSISSNIPVLEKEDGFHARISTGQYHLQFNSYAFNDLKQINVKGLVNSIKDEVWSINNNLSIRQNDIKGVTSVDPKQSYVPGEWQNLPAYDVSESIKIETVHRGLNLTDDLSYSDSRVSWYGFNEGVMTHQDTMSIENNGKGFLKFQPDLKPLEFQIANEPQMLVKNHDAQGIVLKQGNYLSQLNSQTQTDFSKNFLSDTKQNMNSWILNLAPRYRLIYVSGVDKAWGSWIDNWNLYTLFAFFLISFAFYRLFGLSLAILSGVSILFFQSNVFLSWSFWPMLLLLMALLKVLPSANKFTYLVKVLSVILLCGFISMTLEFTANEVRYILNPSLDTEMSRYNPVAQTVPGVAMDKDMAEESEKRKDTLNAPAAAPMMSSIAMPKKFSAQAQSSLVVSNKNQKIQVSPGLPTWSGSSYSIEAKKPSQNVSFYIASPWMVDMTALLQIADLWIIMLCFIIYLLYITNQKQWLDKLPSKLRENVLVMSFLSAKNKENK